MSWRNFSDIPCTKVCIGGLFQGFHIFSLRVPGGINQARIWLSMDRCWVSNLKITLIIFKPGMVKCRQETAQDQELQVRKNAFRI